MNVRSALAMFLLLPAANAAELKQETVQAWNEYIQTVNSQMEERLHPDHSFLWIDESPDRSRRVRAGEILASPVGPHNPKKVPSGLIHHWIGAMFLPGARVDDVFSVLRDYGRYKDYYRPTVLDSKLVSHGSTGDKFSMLLMNKAVFLKIALDSDYQSSYFRLDDRRWYSVAYTTRVQEIEDYGQPDARRLPADEGGGYIWRLYSITRFEERDGGVYVEVEAIALSRDIPLSLRWMVEPIVRRVSKNSLLTSLRQTQQAVDRMVASSAGDRPVIGSGPRPLPADTVQSFR
ncbi:MAG TPA: hypothetical protein VKV15_19170 [Bryobacteraceae bacterium]|nr:hypothetical protein [Bryobacteraceae bacterium]